MSETDEKSRDLRASLQQFTKSELIDYIAAVDFRLQRYPPERYILEIRLNRTYAEIDANLNKTEELISAAKAQQINALTFHTQHAALMEEWYRLNNKQKKIEESLYPKEAQT